MMDHDSWPRDKCVATLQRLHQAFSQTRRSLLGGYHTDLAGQRSLQAHSHRRWHPHLYPGLRIRPRYDERLSADHRRVEKESFVEGGWRCVGKHLIESLSLCVDECGNVYAFP